MGLVLVRCIFRGVEGREWHRGALGARAPWRVRDGMCGDPVDRREVRGRPRDAAQNGAAS